MTRSELNEEYFNWMYQLVCQGEKRRSYRKLLHYLHSVEFTYTLDMDANRAEDGIDLRYRFGYEFEYPGPMIAAFLDDRPCSVLEMMVALANRCEEQIMDDPHAGCRRSQWFFDMLASLGLSDMDDHNYGARAERIIARFLSRQYARNGAGGLFTVNSRHDMRNAEIWYQLNWYLDSIL